MHWQKWFSLVLTAIIMTSCGGREVLAPVEEGRWQAFNPRAHTYKVQPKDTLFAIAFRYDQDYQQLARRNHIAPPYTLRIGQVLRLGGVYYLPVQKKHPHDSRSKANINTKHLKSSSGSWIWPTSGRVVKHYSPALHMKGIDIQGHANAKIYAAQSGTIAYSGNGLAGYGNLIIIKHSGAFLTAYGFNAKNLVREGQFIKKGEVIADIGKIYGQYWGVHFEVRKYGKPVDPLLYLR